MVPIELCCVHPDIMSATLQWVEEALLATTIIATPRVAPATVDCSMFPVDSEKEREVLEAHLQTRSYIQG